MSRGPRSGHRIFRYRLDGLISENRLRLDNHGGDDTRVSSNRSRIRSHSMCCHAGEGSWATLRFQVRSRVTDLVCCTA